jgi:hypothetical protein
VAKRRMETASKYGDNKRLRKTGNYFTHTQAYKMSQSRRCSAVWIYTLPAPNLNSVRDTLCNFSKGSNMRGSFTTETHQAEYTNHYMSTVLNKRNL